MEATRAPAPATMAADLYRALARRYREALRSPVAQKKDLRFTGFAPVQRVSKPAGNPTARPRCSSDDADRLIRQPAAGRNRSKSRRREPLAICGSAKSKVKGSKVSIIPSFRRIALQQPRYAAKPSASILARCKPRALALLSTKAAKAATARQRLAAKGPGAGEKLQHQRLLDRVPAIEKAAWARMLKMVSRNRFRSRTDCVRFRAFRERAPFNLPPTIRMERRDGGYSPRGLRGPRGRSPEGRRGGPSHGEAVA